ncbi:MAG: hypothetical protein HYZ53_03975 [Planctomycetes bacterium]|nr:hypothetical protein [Planctomycetota bacterium]
MSNWPSSSSARWLLWTNSTPQGYSDNNTVYFVMTWVARTTHQAELLITADDAFLAYWNGDLILLGSDWRKAYCQLAGVMVGLNVLAVKVSNAGGPGGLLMDLRVRSSTLGAPKS